MLFKIHYIYYKNFATPTHRLQPNILRAHRATTFRLYIFKAFVAKMEVQKSLNHLVTDFRFCIFAFTRVFYRLSAHDTLLYISNILKIYIL